MTDPLAPAAPATLVILTGLSGSGKTTALHALEDIGFYTVDNLPPSMWVSTVEAVAGHRTRIALGVDIRAGAFLAEAADALAALRAAGHAPAVVFLDASDQTLVRRYSFTRRTHPLAEGTLSSDLSQERDALAALRSVADIVIDTTALSAADLTHALRDRFTAESGFVLRLLSFGYKRGIPTDVDTVLDVRAMPNPYYDPVLRPLPGTDLAVQAHVFNAPALELYAELRHLVRALATSARAGGRTTYSVAVGCTGGQHRSVAVVDRLSYDLMDGYRIQSHHRDLAEALAEHGASSG